MGYYLEALAEKEFKALAVKVPWHSLNPQKKVQHWNKKFYECWCDELCIIMDRLPSSVANKDLILQNTWKTMKLDGFDDLYLAKKAGGLKKADFSRMTSKGYLQRVTKKVSRFRIVTYTPAFLIAPFYFIYRLFRKCFNLFKRQGD